MGGGGGEGGGGLGGTVAKAAWVITSKPSRRQRPRGKAEREGRAVEWDTAPSLVERANRACDSSRLRVPVASVCSVAAVDIGRPLTVGVDGPGRVACLQTWAPSHVVPTRH